MGDTGELFGPDEALGWGDAASAKRTSKGTKGRQRSDTEDRAVQYRTWRWGAGFGCVTDLDQIEWRKMGRRWQACAVFELTRYDDRNREPNEAYLAAIVERMSKRDKQAQLAVEAGRKLNCDAFVVLFQIDMHKVWVYNLTVNMGPKAWRKFTLPEWTTWLRQLDAVWHRRKERVAKERAAGRE